MAANLQLGLPPALARPQSTPFYRSAVFLFSLASALTIYLGWAVVPLARYITPERGLGYALGIIGGGSMIALLIYPARKRLRWLAPIGSVKGWFRAHMVLGVVGPILVLYHANFSFGATNSNVALICMLLVAGSGLIGRYFYTKIHEGLFGHASTLAELQERAKRLQLVNPTSPLLAGLIERLAIEESQLQATVGRHPVVLRPFSAALLSILARRRLVGFIRRSARTIERPRRTRQAAMAREYARTRIAAMRRVCEYEAYATLFSWWHILHLPLFLLLLLAGIAHVVAVHVY